MEVPHTVARGQLVELARRASDGWPIERFDAGWQGPDERRERLVAEKREHAIAPGIVVFALPRARGAVVTPHGTSQLHPRPNRRHAIRERQRKTEGVALHGPAGH